MIRVRLYSPAGQLDEQDRCSTVELAIASLRDFLRRRQIGALVIVETSADKLPHALHAFCARIGMTETVERFSRNALD